MGKSKRIPNKYAIGEYIHDLYEMEHIHGKYDFSKVDIPPRFVMLIDSNDINRKTALRIKINFDDDYQMYYHRDAGCWNVGFKMINDEYFVDEPDEHSIMHFANGYKLVPCTYEEWAKGNGIDQLNKKD